MHGAAAGSGGWEIVEKREDRGIPPVVGNNEADGGRDERRNTRHRGHSSDSLGALHMVASTSKG